MSGRFPALMYHRLESARCPVTNPEERAWAVPLPEFIRQMDRLKALGRVGVSMDRIHRTLESGLAIPEEWVVITFDDGNRSDYDHALPVLTDRGFQATFFICGERVGDEADLSSGMVRTMHEAGMHIGSHAMTHRFMSVLGASEEEQELGRSRQLLESIVSAPVVHFAPPGGRWSRRTARALERAGFAAVSTSRYGFNAAEGRRFSYRRLPVVRSTPAGRFDAMVRAQRWRLLPGYARAETLRLARRLLGETAYGRARAARKEP